MYLLAVGKLRPSLRQAVDQYLERLQRDDPVIEHQIREPAGRHSPTEQRRIEAQGLLGKIPDRALVVALDRGGQSWSSEELAIQLDRWRQSSRPITLVIGGSTGLDQSLLERADQRWSLGPLTLPHELARLVVVEQWYRAWTILRGEKYHK